MPLQLRRAPSELSVKPPVAKESLMDVDKPRNVQIDVRSDKFNYENANHAGEVLATFDFLRKKSMFTDVILSTNNREFSCHRAVLMAGSRYFQAMFCNDHRESREMLVEINGMQEDVMEVLLDYLYTSRVTINAKNVQLLLEASNLFQIISLFDVCCEFLDAQLHPCNCIEMKEFADRICLSELYNNASDMMNEKFADVVLHEEFLELPKSRVIDYISDDDINVSREELVYEAVKRWVAFDPTVRSEYFPELLSYVRIPLIHPTYFVNTIECDELVAANPACQDLMKETRKYHILGNEINSERTRPRQSTGCSVAVVIVGGYDRIGGYSTPSVDAYDPATTRWSSLAKLPTFTKSEYAVASFRNSIIVSGGKIHSRDVWLYQSQIDNWMKISSLCKGRWRHRMIALGGHVYCVGGYDGKNTLKSVEQYDSFFNTWREVAPLLFPVSLFALAACHGKLFVIGTQDVTTPCKVQVYNPDTDLWSVKSSLPRPFTFITAAALNGIIYVVGNTGSNQNMCVYDPMTDTWSIHDLSQPNLDQCGITACGGQLYITGGKGEESETSNTVFCYDTSSKEMHEVACMPRSSCYHGCVTIHRFNTK